MKLRDVKKSLKDVSTYRVVVLDRWSQYIGEYETFEDIPWYIDIHSAVMIRLMPEDHLWTIILRANKEEVTE